MTICRLAKRNCLFLATFIGIALVFMSLKDVHRMERNDTGPHYQDEAIQTQLINVFLVVTSLEDSRHLPVQLKSILYYRTSPVFLHLFVSSDLMERIINTLLFSWQADKVFFKVYRFPHEQVPMTAYQLLFFFRKHLPRFLKKGVYMNRDVVFKSDILQWMESCSTLAMETTALADEPGCHGDSLNCTGSPNLMYVDLTDEKDESKLGVLPCHMIPFRRNQPECSSRRVTGMDGILAVNRSDFYADGYEENPLHLSIRESIMVVDASPPNVWSHIRNSNSYQDVFTSLQQQLNSFSFHEISSARRQFDENMSNSTEKPECRKFVDIAYMKRRTHLFYHCGNQWVKGLEKVSTAAGDISVTLMTVLTLDRFASLERMLSHWKGPSAVLLYLNDMEASRKLPRLMKDSRALNNKEIRDRTAIHVVYQRPPYNPLNYLRNVLLNNTFTSHVFYLDVDLPPNPDLYKSILKHLNQSVDTERRSADKKIFMVPAFQSFLSLEKNFPRTKQDLLKFIKEETITGYKQKEGWSLGHKPTNYSHWLKADKPYHAKFMDAFEPYVVAPRRLQAYFNEDLLERMGDKIAYTRLIHGMGYDYYVLPDDFVIHLPHPISLGTMNYYTEPNMFTCGSYLFEKYRKRLYDMFPERHF